jgi:hypothetical protein
VTSDFEDLTTRIATAVATTGLRIPDDGAWPDNINPPAALLTPGDSSALDLAETSTTERFDLIAVVQLGGSRRDAMRRMAPYISRTGLKSVTLALRTGLSGDLLQVNRRQTGQFEIDGVVLWGARWELEVISQ